MQQHRLFHESIYDALRDIVVATGGYKKVGSDLWPSLSADKAGRDLNDCLNPDNARKLDPVELIWLLKRGRDAGVHVGMAYLCQDLAYAAPQPIDPETEIQKLQREFIAAQQGLVQLADRIERRITTLRAA